MKEEEEDKREEEFRLNCHQTRGWHGRKDADGRCLDCGERLPPGPPDSPRPLTPNFG